MSEQRNRVRTAVQEALGGLWGAHNCLLLNALSPLLGLSGRGPFSKGISKGPSKGGSATRYRAARGGLLDGYLMLRNARGGSNDAKMWCDKHLEQPGVLDGCLTGRGSAP